ncbi:hypothetical protein [Psychrobacter sp. 72-O-c]|uniref:Cap15 family cyclic dinucleotide receptor domain-containing protein n=1 Tax=Psychrobacter sp. 72-O-c TaxID=2774125 RepID=UPI0019194A42|nr:hypothetical protein [Psychrobacter sp. 72-O-c]
MSIKGHEYTVQNGMNRSKVGKTLYSLSTILTALIVSQLIRYLTWFESVPTLISTVLLTIISFYIVYNSFNNWLWKLKPISKLLKLPDISGNWSCNGKSDHENFNWYGKVQITQSWDKIRIVLTTEQSSSESISAAITYDDIRGYKLVYNYENRPNSLDDTNLRTHIGFVDLNIGNENNVATGHYYNVSGRKTSGKITWNKE